jgi:uncharacterized protein YqgV (UPF0045/DUF77 family)
MAVVEVFSVPIGTGSTSVSDYVVEFQKILILPFLERELLAEH